MLAYYKADIFCDSSNECMAGLQPGRYPTDYFCYFGLESGMVIIYSPSIQSDLVYRSILFRQKPLTDSWHF